MIALLLFENIQKYKVGLYILHKELDEIGISSAARLEAEDPIKAGSMEIDVSSAAKGVIALDVGDLEMDISSAGNLDLSGKANTMEVDISSAGTLRAYDLVCKDAEVDVSSAGTAKVNVTGRFEGDASSGGSIRYQGEPDIVYANSSSGGSVKKVD